MKRWAAPVLLVLALFGAAIGLVPGLRQALLGERLARHLQAGAGEELVQATVLSLGQEIRPLSEGPQSLLPGQAVPASYDLRVSLEETVEGAGVEPVLRYRVGGVVSEQVGTAGGQDLVGGVFQARIGPAGLLQGLSRVRGRESRVLDDRLLEEALAGFWPELPAGRARPGATWAGRYETRCEPPLVAPARVVLQHRLRYLLEGFHEEGDLTVARILVRGEVVPRAEGELPEPLEVGGTGKVEGTVLVDVATGKAVLADDRVASTVVVRDPGQGMEVVSFTDRRSRTWRPRHVPDGLEGFDASLPALPGPPSAGPSPQPSPHPGAAAPHPGGPHVP